MNKQWNWLSLGLPVLGLSALVAGCPAEMTEVDAASTFDAPSEVDAGSDASVDAPLPSDASGCPTGQTRCGATCVDLTSTVANCGACGTVCAAPTGGAPTCTAGGCGVMCNSGRTACGTGAATTCPDVMTDPANCGACGNACPDAQLCVAGRCQIDCPAPSTICVATDVMSCINTANDTAHCGRCDNACPTPANATAACNASTCGIGACATGFADCDSAAANGCEVNTTNTLTSCGTCGTVCAPPANATATCEDSACGFTCLMGFADCDGVASNGCEVVLASDVNACGACGMMCPPLANASPSCALGTCGIGSCAMNFADCDGVVSTGCETALLTTPTACGACGRVCTTPNATAGCAGGSCTVTACAAGFADCDANAANGCEVNTTNTPTSCGACGRVCATPAHAIPTCGGSSCGFTCVAGFADCDGLPANGCETDLSAPASCGRCGNVCTVSNGTPACAMGTCSVATCNSGFANCNGAATDGCETNSNTDTRNCGLCGRVCPSGNSCTAGACTAPTCRAGSNMLSQAPSGLAMICDHPTDAVCEQDFQTMCPPAWHLCTRPEFIARNDGWSYVPSQRPVGEIFCRSGGAAGHFTIGWSNTADAMSVDPTNNCGFGSSRTACPSGFGCNEQNAFALCCAPNPTCGNGVVDALEECDDANASEADDCLNSCAWRVPTAHGVSGAGC